jgi:anaerobic magnesium-protoporphyrin IX monomethyl ester cyclase
MKGNYIYMINLILVYSPNINYEGYGQDRAWFPLGIAYLASYVEKYFEGEINITCLDLFNKTIDESVNIIDSYYQDGCINVVGCTMLTEQRFGTLKLLEGINQFFIKIVGGVHATLMKDQIDKFYSFIDFIILGEGEAGLLYVLNKLTNEKHYGLIIDGSEKIIDQPNIKDLDTIPYPINSMKFFKTEWNYGEQIPIIASRGCTDCCTFCSTTKFWKGYRTRSAENIFCELKAYRQEGYLSFKFQDDACTANLSMWKELCKLIIESKLNITFEITARIDQFDEELIYLLRDAGCNRIAVGIESGSKLIRGYTNKNLNDNNIFKNSRIIRQASIILTLMFIAGLPGESDQTIFETIEFIKLVGCDYITCQPLMIFPGTSIYKSFVAAELIDDDYWLVDQPQPYYMPHKSFRWQQQILALNMNV